MNLALLLEMAAGAYEEREAVRCGDAALSYLALDRSARAAAAELLASGCRNAAYQGESSLAVPIGLFAAARAGVPFAPLSYRATPVETDKLLARLAPVHLVTDRTGSGAAEEATAALPEDVDAPAILLFTSGTTGEPKAAVLRHRHLVSYVLATVEFGSADASEATLVAVPPYHVAGMAALLSSVYAGRRIVQLPRFDPQRWIEAVLRERITHAFLVPTMLTRIVDALANDAIALPSLRAIAYGGGKMPLPVIERALALLPQVDFTNAYGLTETSSTVALLTPAQHREAQASDAPALRRRLGSVGRPLPQVTIEIRRPDGTPAAPEERGEVYVRGEQVAGEYLERGSQLAADGWLATRDAGWLDAEGFLFLEGRLDDVIVRGGENISPGEIEDVLRAHPAVADCAVVGVPDVEWGEAVAAAIVLRPAARASTAELQQWVRERLRSSRTPARIEIWDTLPYTETGKLLRRHVRTALLGA